MIATIGEQYIQHTLRSIEQSNSLPKEILIVLPEDNKNNISNLMLKFKSLNLKLLISKKKNQVHQRIIGFKKSTNNFVMQIDDDVILDKNCLITLYKFLKTKKNAAVAPRYKSSAKISKIYRKPDNIILYLYHWLINSKKGYDPGKISLSGFNYAQENKKHGYIIHDWLSGGAVMHHKKNLITKNYYPYNFKKSFCEDLLHSLIMRKRRIILYKNFDTYVSTKSGSITENYEKIKIFKDLYSEFLIRRYIVRKFNLSNVRLNIYYLIYLLRIVLKIIK